MNNLGIALSGGGSRAIGFHRGTLRALDELGLVERIDVVSTVSGGSVFGCGWMCSQLEGKRTSQFLSDLEPILRRGFIAPSLLSPRALKMLLPGFTRTHRLAEVFGDLLLGYRQLSALPARPLLCVNATVLNHGMPGRFSRGGFSCDLVGERDHEGSYPETRLTRRDLGFAVAASAAFPFALPPVALGAEELPALQGALQGQRQLLLTDGGVLDNLGVERLLSGGRFATRHIIVSDAGVAETAWAPSLVQSLLSFGAFALARKTLSRLLAVMNDKQNRTMRQLALRRVGALEEPHQERRLWFVRIDQTWEAFFGGVPHSRLRAVARTGAELPRKGAPAADVVTFLEAQGIDLSRARAHYDEADGVHANGVTTNFTGLKPTDLVALEKHAMWQVHACHAVYGDIIPPPRRDSAA